MKPEDKLKFIRGMEKLQSSPVKPENYESPLEKDAMKVKGGAAPAEVIQKIKTGTEKIDTMGQKKLLSGSDFAAKIAALRGMGKKALGVIPMAGTAYGLMSGDPAMAAEEVASDVTDLAAPIAAKMGAASAAGPIGIAAMTAQQALSPSESGNVEEENMMLAERNAMEDYKKSPAAMARKKALESF